MALLDKPKQFIATLLAGDSTARGTVVALCLTLLVVRAVLPDLRFDVVSLVLFLCAVLVLLVPDVGEQVNRIKEIQKGDLKILLDPIAREVEEIEEQQASSSSGDARIEVSPDKMKDSLRDGTETDPNLILYRLSVEIEIEVRRLAEEHLAKTWSRPLVPTIRELVANGVLTARTGGAVRQFWALRNKVTHLALGSLADEARDEIVDLGLRVLSILRTESSSGSTGSLGSSSSP